MRSQRYFSDRPEGRQNVQVRRVDYLTPYIVNMYVKDYMTICEVFI